MKGVGLMKRILVMLCTFILVGCSSVSQTEYQKVVEENQVLTKQVEELTEKLSSYDEIVDVRVSGGFVATVFDRMADPEVDSSVENVLSIHFFQGDFEYLTVSKEISDQIEVGKTYYFEFEPFVVRKDYYSMSISDVEYVLASGIDSFGMNVVKVREAREDEMGLAQTLFVEENIVKK